MNVSLSKFRRSHFCFGDGLFFQLFWRTSGPFKINFLFISKNNSFPVVTLKTIFFGEAEPVQFVFVGQWRVGALFVINTILFASKHLLHSSYSYLQVNLLLYLSRTYIFLHNNSFNASFLSFVYFWKPTTSLIHISSYTLHLP